MEEEEEETLPYEHSPGVKIRQTNRRLVEAAGVRQLGSPAGGMGADVRKYDLSIQSQTLSLLHSK